MYIVDDLVSTPVDCILAADPYGLNISIFLDLVRVLADCKIVEKLLDFNGHNSLAPCSLYALGRKKKTWVKLQKHIYGAFAESGLHQVCKLHPSFARFCTERGSRTVDRSHDGGIDVIQKSLIISLHDRLKKRIPEVPLTVDGKAVVSACLDRYLNVSVALYLALKVIRNNTMDFFFRGVLYDQTRRIAYMHNVTHLSAKEFQIYQKYTMYKVSLPILK